MRVMRPAVGLFVAAAMCAGSASAEPLQPVGPWRVTYDVAQCVAMRDYGTAQKPLTLVLKPSATGGVMRLLVIRKGSVLVEEQPARLRFGSRVLDTSLLHYSDDKSHFRVVAINVPMAEFKADLAAPFLDIQSGPISASFALTDLPAVSAELDKCVVDLRDFWNMGDAFKSRIATPERPQKPLNALFSPSDYPDPALRQYEQGRVTLTFLVDEKGQVADCTVEDTSGIPVLDTMSCYVISRRAQFAPALGPDGKPVRSAHQTRIVWRIAGI
jgi:TonB family protein